MAKKKKPAAKPAAVKERPVLVTTTHRGVFFGYLQSRNGDSVKLRAARNCLYWDRATKGFLGLAQQGPSSGCRIGPAADIELLGITGIADVTADAVAKWEAAPWSN